MFVHCRDLSGWEGAQLGALGPIHLHFPRVDMYHVLAFFHLPKCTMSTWLFLVRMLRDT